MPTASAAPPQIGSTQVATFETRTAYVLYATVAGERVVSVLRGRTDSNTTRVRAARGYRRLGYVASVSPHYEKK